MSPAELRRKITDCRDQIAAGTYFTPAKVDALVGILTALLNGRREQLIAAKQTGNEG